jgi:phosphohistidine phosphatase
MDLILWRHAEATLAEDGADDATRALTPKGERQAARIAQWLDRQLSDGTRILCSPARRTEQTALALQRKFKFREELGPQSNAEAVLDLVKWHADMTVPPKQSILLVGHQPWMGDVIMSLTKLPSSACAVRKASVWWLRARERNQQLQILIHAVINPEIVGGLQ